MGFFKSLILGGLGWSLFGPLGAIIGVILGSMLNVKPDDIQSKKTSTDNNKNSGNDFQIVLLVLFAAVMKADGKVVKSELNAVKKILLQNYGEEGALEALQILKSLLQQNIDVQNVAIQCGKNLSYSARLQLLHMLAELAAADAEIEDSEKVVLIHIAMYMGVSLQDTNSIIAMFKKNSNNNWAYEVLEIAPECSDEEVKKAYHRMAMKYHPDKVNNLGEEVKQKATEKFRQVKDAYEAIKTQRGI